MTWIKLATGFPWHPKVVEVGPTAAWIYVVGLCYSVEHETNGELSSAVLRSIMPHSKRRAAVMQALCTARLWHEHGDGVRIHDFAEWQRTSKHDSAERAATSREIAHPDSANGAAQLPLPDLGFSRARARGRAARAPSPEVEEKERREPPLTPPEGGNAVPVYPRGGHRQRERKAYAEDCAAYAEVHGIAEGPRAVHQAVYYGKARTHEEVEAFVAQHWSGDDG